MIMRTSASFPQVASQDILQERARIDGGEILGQTLAANTAYDSVHQFRVASLLFKKGLQD